MKSGSSVCFLKEHEWTDTGIPFNEHEFVNVFENLNRAERIIGSPRTNVELDAIKEIIGKKMTQLDTRKKRMLVLCHGRNHRKLNQEILDEYEVVFVDASRTSNPDVVCDISQHLHLFLPYGPFDVVSFVYAPCHLFSDQYVRDVVSQLVKKDGYVFFQHLLRSPNHMICRNCGQEQMMLPFLLGVKKLLYPSINIKDVFLYQPPPCKC